MTAQAQRIAAITGRPVATPIIQRIKSTDRKFVFKAINALLAPAARFSQWKDLVEAVDKARGKPGAGPELDKIGTVEEAIDFVKAALKLGDGPVVDEAREAVLVQLIAEATAEEVHPSFTLAVKQKLRILGELTAGALRAATGAYSAIELQSVLDEARRSAIDWERRKQFMHRTSERTADDVNALLKGSEGPLELPDRTLGAHGHAPDAIAFEEFAPEVNIFDKHVVEVEEEVAIWRAFLDRPLSLGDRGRIEALQAAVQKVLERMRALEADSPDDRFKLVATHSKLKAERMKLSNTLYGRGDLEALLKAGKGNEVAATPLGGQWDKADKLMIENARKAFTARKVQLSPDMLLQINAEEGGGASANSQVTGEPRYSSILLGSKAGKGSYNLSLVPPRLVVPELVSLVNDINYHLANIRRAEDIWLVIPIAARFYTDFISIHPFPDGNGRTARKAVDFMLMGFGLPPAQFEGAMKNFGAGIPQQGKPTEVERSFGDEEAIDHMMTAVLKALETLGKG